MHSATTNKYTCRLNPQLPQLTTNHVEDTPETITNINSPVQ